MVRNSSLLSSPSWSTSYCKSKSRRSSGLGAKPSCLNASSSSPTDSAPSPSRSKLSKQATCARSHTSACMRPRFWSRFSCTTGLTESSSSESDRSISASLSLSPISTISGFSCTFTCVIASVTVSMTMSLSGTLLWVQEALLGTE